MPEPVRSSSGRRRRGNGSNGGATQPSERSSAPQDRRSGRNASGLRLLFVDITGYVILTLWAVAFTIDMFNVVDDFEVDSRIYGLMTIVAGAAFVGSVIKKGPEE